MSRPHSQTWAGHVPPCRGFSVLWLSLVFREVSEMMAQVSTRVLRSPGAGRWQGYAHGRSDQDVEAPTHVFLLCLESKVTRQIPGQRKCVTQASTAEGPRSLPSRAPRPLYEATGGTGFKGRFFYKLFLSEFQESVPVTSVCGLNQHRPGQPRSPPFVPSPLFLISCSQRGCMFFCVKLSEG